MKNLPRIFVTGHQGMVGSACCRAFHAAGGVELVTATLAELDLCDQGSVFAFLQRERPDAILHAAGKVGGIEANRTQQAAFLYENMMMAANIVEGARRAAVPRLLFLGSSCIYPRLAPQPIPESALLTSALEPTNEGYAIAKITGLKLCQYYRSQYGLCYHSAMPTNLYGTGDNYAARDSHVLPAMIRKFEAAREAGANEVTLWGSGNPMREFLHVDDLAAACLHLLNLENPPDLVNIGSGREVTIRELAEIVNRATGANAELRFDASMPDGTPRKFLDLTLLNSLGWKAAIPLEEGVAKTVGEFRAAKADGTLRE